MKKLQFFLLTVCILFSIASHAQQAFKVEVVGKGNPVLFFAGFGCTGEVWKAAVFELSKQYECHVFTFAGFGGVPSIEDSWLPKIKEEVILYTRRLHLKDAVIIGHSLGGAMGLWLASTEPTLFKKLIVVDALPSTGALMIPNFKAENLQYNNPYSMQLLQMDSTKFRAQLKQQVSYMVLNKEKVEELVNTMAMSDRKTYVNGYTDLLKLDLREEIARISVPVIVLAATFPNKDAIEKNYNTQYEKLANKKIYFADNSAHFIMFDQPDWLLTKLKENIQ